MSPVIEVTDLSKVFEPTPWWMRLMVRSSIKAPVAALTDVNFSVGRGEILTIVGPNGAGKSTLFRILTGLTTASSGQVRISGLDPENQGPEVRSRVGFMPADDRTLFLRHTCYENLDFHGRLQGMSAKRRRKRIDETLELVSLTEARHRAGFALSSGMKSRLLFARAIFHEPEVLILDEPTGPVDPIAAYELLKQIRLVSKESGVTTLMSSHRVEEIEALADNVLFLDRGKVMFLGDLDDVARKLHGVIVLVSFNSSAAAKGAENILSKDGIVVERAEAELSVHCAEGTGTGPMLARLGEVLDSVTGITESRPPFREVLRALTGDSK